MSKRRSDFVQVRLSAAGLQLAGDGPLSFANRHFQYTFQGTKPVRVVERYEWLEVLSKESFEGKSIFELLPDAAPAEVTNDEVSEGSK